ncbi:hypothetical protein H2199_002042 [Coniosporium tulheliwenetii]|uniref:Uncharacterized protein n=1 Tax=Coniosporium tulheliwenetii TaxID=3383036 RepID=A0ACC2ZGW1_9PEZI|nr:hypothetical protein H2199_002042 [Cladosporium sp. JES 115]
MLRLRRYRVFVAFAILTVLAFYKFSSTRNWDATSALTPESLKHGTENLKEQIGLKPELETVERLKPEKPESDPLDAKVPVAERPQTKVAPPPVQSPKELIQSIPISSKALAPLPTATPPAQTDDDVPTIPPDARPNPHFVDAPVEGGGEGRLEVEPTPDAAPIYWERQEEHFPVTSTIQLPLGTPKAIPKIQHSFKKLSGPEEEDRKGKLAVITDAFRHAWAGYKAKAWMHDELSPVSGGHKDPFGGWGATLVDSLDTLWIMGMKDEFEDAVKAVGKIEFTTSPRADIPVFETTIRYLGGLLAAYDMSDGKYRSLLDKAVELAEVLMGAFDTPNRMPITFYYWRPAYASQSHRAQTRVVLAELGSLSLEFTRLAQITKEPKYYDAVARVTDALEDFQNRTRLPGMWPTYVDASGCQRPKVQLPNNIPGHLSGVPGINGRPLMPGQTNPQLSTSDELGDATPADQIYPIARGAEIDGEDEDNDASSHLDKRQLEAQLEQPVLEEPLCIPQGLESSSEFGGEQYTLGGMADSTYEYLPKMWLLLGGREDKYRTMYEKAIDAVKEKLLFRPMVPGGNDILFAGSYNTGYPPGAGEKPAPWLDAEGAHLTCFAGGMFALGAKVFEREEDLDIAAKLTEGCIWAYNATNSGIMPEQFFVVSCEDRKSCQWNETKWWEILDPFEESRMNAYKGQLAYYEQRVKQAALDMKTQTPANVGGVESTAAVVAQPTASPAPGREEDRETKKHKRQLDGTWNPENDPPTPVAPFPDPPLAAASASIAAIYKPEPPVSREEYVKSRIAEERLPKGFVQIPARKYILSNRIRLLHVPHNRLPHWRDAGWRMFKAIQAATRTEFGNSAIDDVTKAHPELADTMESFWLAETLKYFWLLFADEEEVDLDLWVLNTEAHPFRRPKS